MKFSAGIATLILVTVTIAGAQVASHAPTNAQDIEKPVARVNLFGFAVGELFFARPFERPNAPWQWGVQLVPGG